MSTVEAILTGELPRNFTAKINVLLQVHKHQTVNGICYKQRYNFIYVLFIRLEAG